MKLRASLFVGMALSLVPCAALIACGTSTPVAPLVDAAPDVARSTIDARASDDADADAGPSIEARCNALFDAALASARRCPRGNEISGDGHNPSERPNYVRSCVAQASAPGYDLSRLDACLAEAQTSTVCVDGIELEASLPPNFAMGARRALFACLKQPGTLKAGAPCAYDSQCASLSCVRTNVAGNPDYCGTCSDGIAQITGPLPDGGTCDESAPRCRSGSMCIDSTCVPSAGLGEACEGVSCGPKLLCHPNETGPDTCKALLPVGADCTKGPCEMGLSCVGGTCTQVAIGKLGDDCSSNNGIVFCGEDLTCQDAANETRKCVSIQDLWGQLGEPCQQKNKYGCHPTLWCDHGTCQPREVTRCASPADAGAEDATAPVDAESGG